MDQIARRPFQITPEMAAEIEDEITQTTDQGQVAPPSAYSMSVITVGAEDRTLFTFVELDSYPVFRISRGGVSTDHVLNSDQVKLLLRQMTLWLTR